MAGRPILALLEVVRSDPSLIGVLTADSLEQLLAVAGASVHVHETVARLLLRRKVWCVRLKAEALTTYSEAQTKAALAKYQLPAALAARCGLPELEGQTWLDAVDALKRGSAAAGETPSQLWARVETHPMVEYVPMQCQTCGKQLLDKHPAPEDPNLSEEAPTDEERPFVRAGYFRGPRGPVVFIYRCPECRATSRWFRASAPEVTLNPHRWGRLCGEQEDLKTWLAQYLGVRLRVCVPLDWDHVWTEVWDGTEWRPLDPNCVNFARRLNEGIGSWTGVLALGTPGSGGGATHTPAAATEDVTEAYMLRAQGTPQELAAWRAQVAAACAAGPEAATTGEATQARTLCGHVLQRAGFDAARSTAELRAAQADFDAGRACFELGGVET